MSSSGILYGLKYFLTSRLIFFILNFLECYTKSTNFITKIFWSLLLSGRNKSNLFHFSKNRLKKKQIRENISI